MMLTSPCAGSIALAARRARGSLVGAPADPMTACGHRLCALVGGDCSLLAGVSRGCQTGPRRAAPFDPAVVDEVTDLLARLAPEVPDDAAAAAAHRAAATRLAFVFRREARSGRNLLALAADDQLEPELRERLESLCRRRG
jgi:hypothetical protein